MEKNKVLNVHNVVDVRSCVKYDILVGSNPAPKKKSPAKWLADEKDANGTAYHVYIWRHGAHGFAWCEYC